MNKHLKTVTKFIIFFKIYVFMYLFLAELGLCC